jgi:glycosyltransferase involved in cell wall biosynthesis
MKVVHISFSFLIGGIENMVVDILNEQCVKAITHLIIINKSYDQKIIDRLSDKVLVSTFDRPKGSLNIFYLIKLWALIFKLNPDVVHCHTPKTILLLLPFKKKCVYTVHNIGISIKHLNLYKKLFAISKAVQQDLLKRGGLKSQLVYNGINFESFKARTNYSLRENDILKIVLISRLLHEQKGQDILIKSLNKLVNHQYVTNIHVDIIGDGPSQEFLDKLAHDLKVKNYITFVGPKDRSWVYDNLSNYHVLIQPSRFEGFGLTVLEAVAARIPVIASNIDGPSEVLTDIPSAFLFESEQIDALTFEIMAVKSGYVNKLIEADCKSAFSILKDKFDVANTANNYLENYLK